MIEAKDIKDILEAQAEATPRAVNTFDRLSFEGKSVAGGFHPTC